MGDLVGGKFHGDGIFFFKSGGTYRGTFKHGEMDGLGRRVFANGSTYEGAFVKGEICGEGMMHWANDTQYIGIWKNNTPHGRGVIMQVHTGILVCSMCLLGLGLVTGLRGFSSRACSAGVDGTRGPMAVSMRVPTLTGDVDCTQ